MGPIKNAGVPRLLVVKAFRLACATCGPGDRRIDHRLLPDGDAPRLNNPKDNALKVVLTMTAVKK
jgi:hypothetical protein